MPHPTYHPGIAGKMPMKGRRASATKTVHTAVPQVEADLADIEDFAPPEWRTVLNNRADLGYPDFYPSRPGFNQTEDVLSEEFVKNGFSARTFVAVGAESFSMHGPIFGHLMNGCVGMLNRLGQDIAENRDRSMPQFRVFKIPNRVTYNDAKRAQFLLVLANPSIPLHRLMRNNVPHGFKGTDLFESMFSPQISSTQAHNRPNSNPASPSTPIPLDRALWFIRVLGANDISAHRSRSQTIAVPVAAPSPIPATPSSTNTSTPANTITLSSNDWYTQDFTAMFTTWLRIQINQLALPNKSQPKSGLPAPKAPVGILGDEKGRAKWLAKWDYSMKLLNELRAHCLLSNRLFVAWLVDILAIANLAQVGFIAQLIGDYLPEITRHLSLARACIRAACSKILEIHISPVPNALSKIEQVLRHIVVSLIESDSKVLLSPAAWRRHKDTIEKIMEPVPKSEDSAPIPSTSTISADRKNSILGMKARSERLMFKPAATESTRSPRRQQMEDLHKLDAMDADTDMTQLCKSYFDGSASPTSPIIDMSRLEDKTFVLLNWAMSLFHLGVHRAYAVDTLLTIWSKLHTKSHPNSPEMDFFPILYKWLDTSEAAIKGENAFAIGITFGDLTRQGLFSYRRYLQVLIARGHSARSRSIGEAPSHHIPSLTAMPIFVQAKDLLHQRKLALCGDDEEAAARLDAEEDRLMNEFREDVREYVPEIFGMVEYGRSASLKDVVYHQMPSATALNRHLFLQARFWIISLSVEGLKARPGKPAISASAFARLLHVYHLCNGYSSTADLLIRALTSNDDDEILDIVIDSIRRNADVWTANDKWQLLTNALLDRNHTQDEQGRHYPRLASLLLELGQRGRISEDDEEEVQASVDAHRKNAFNSKGWVNALESMGQLHQAISTGTIASAQALGTQLFARHGPFSHWSAIWWSSLIKALQASDLKRKNSVIEASLAHIEQIDEKSEGGLDSAIEHWLEDLTMVTALEIMSSKHALTLVEIFLHLAAQRRLHVVPKLLEKLAYTLWKHSATSAIATKGRSLSKYNQAVSNTLILAQQLLLTVPPDSDLPPLNLQQSLILQTERAKALNKANVPILLRHLPFLVILDTARGTSHTVREQISTLLRGLAKTPHFKAAAFRHIALLKDAFLSNEWTKPVMDPEIEKGMIDTLKLVMSQSSTPASAKQETIASLSPSARFSAWRWTSVVLGMRVEFKRLAKDIEDGNEPAHARETLRDLVHATLNRESTADDTDLLCEAFRGIEPIAAQEIVAVGMERLTSLLSQMIGAENHSALEDFSKTTDLMLRVLDSASLEASNGPTEHAVLASRHGLLDHISLALQAVERQMTQDDGETLPEGIIPPRPDLLFSTLLNLLKFTLGLEVTESTSPVAPRPDYGRLAGVFLRVLVAVHDKCSGETLDSLVDVLTFIVDSTPAQSRSAVHMALLSEMPTGTFAAAIAHHPSLAQALPPISPPRRPVSLIDSSSDDQKSTLPLDDRPWEFIDLLDPPKRSVQHGEMFLATKPLKDTASIPISLFGPKMKRDAVPFSTIDDRDHVDIGEGEEPLSDDGDGTRWDDYTSERNLGDGQAGEPLSIRQIATGLYANAEDNNVEDDALTVRSALSPILTAIAAPTIPSSPAVSTPTTRPRRSSARQAAQPPRPNQPAYGNGGRGKGGSNFDPITFEDSDEDDDDDDDNDDSSDSDKEVEILEAPAGKRARRGGKTVGGKSTRKTVGGKGVARKGVSGKSVRGGAGKAPMRGGYRRRSGAEG